MGGVFRNSLLSNSGTKCRNYHKMAVKASEIFWLHIYTMQENKDVSPNFIQATGLDKLYGLIDRQRERERGRDGQIQIQIYIDRYTWYFSNTDCPLLDKLLNYGILNQQSQLFLTLTNIFNIGTYQRTYTLIQNICDKPISSDNITNKRICQALVNFAVGLSFFQTNQTYFQP